MIYVFSDGSLTSTGMPDNSVAGRGKLGWQGDNESVSSTFFLVYSPKGRPQLRNGVAGQQIGYFSADGSVVGTSSPVANNVTALVQAVVLNYMGLQATTPASRRCSPLWRPESRLRRHAGRPHRLRPDRVTQCACRHSAARAVLSRYDDGHVNSRKPREPGLISPLASLTVLSALCNFPRWRGSFRSHPATRIIN